MTFYKEKQKLINAYEDTLDQECIELSFLDAQSWLVCTPIWRVLDIIVDEKNGVSYEKLDKKLEEALIEKLNKLFLDYFERELKSYAVSYDFLRHINDKKSELRSRKRGLEK